jgi:hypothetical protein
MTDKELIGFCEIHCHSPEPLFKGEDINRLLALAEFPPDYTTKLEPPENYFQFGPGQILPLVKLARVFQNIPDQMNS